MTKICIVAAVAATVAVITPASAFAAGWFQMMPAISETNGFVASILVLTTFTMTDMRTLRIVAICSNVAFIAYSALEWLLPVLILHLTLLPLNVLRLTELADRDSTSSVRDSISVFRSWWRIKRVRLLEISVGNFGNLARRLYYLACPIFPRGETRSSIGDARR
jgi:hypothetical protein